MRALAFTAPERWEIREQEPPVAGPGEALIAPTHVGLCGTDLELFLGIMPYFTQGVAHYPLQPGHEMAGVVVDSGDGGPPVGTRVVVDPVVGCGACDACARGTETHCPDRFERGVRLGMPGAAAELISAPVSKLHVVPDSLPNRAAALVEPGVTVLNAIRRFGDIAGRRALVLGPGTLGCIAIQLLRAGGATVDVLDAAGKRTELIEQLGGRRIAEVPDDAYDLVIEASGAASAMHTSLAAVAAGGQIGNVGVQPEPLDGFDVNALVFKDASLFGVLNGPGLYDELLALMAAGAVDADLLIDVAFPLEEAGTAIARLRERGRTRPKIQLVLGGGE